MQGGILDPELAHQHRTAALAIQLFGQPIVLAHHLGLFGQAGRRRQEPAFGKRACLSENPRVADRAASHGNAIDTRAADHFEAIVGREQIATAQHGSGPDVTFDFAEKFPIALADVPLTHRTPMHGHRRDSSIEGPIEYAEEVVATFRRVVDAPSHLDRHGDFVRHDLARAADDL